MLKQMHKGTQHVGKVPKALRQEMDFTKQQQQLEKQLSKAIETEDYEQAALVRDQLRGLDVPPEDPVEPLEPKAKGAKSTKSAKGGEA
jgi:protein arginine kinase activator